jgi:TPP-dependent pyruvate/acetoin dehydrogenase alpha subunit
LHTGAFHESATLAVAWSLPLVFICESNGWAEFTPTNAWNGPDPLERGMSYGMPGWLVDGADVLAVRDVVAHAVSAARTGGGPAFLEAQTCRGHGHYEGDAQPYRSEEANTIEAADPLAMARRELGMPASEADALDIAAEEEMTAAVEAALTAPYPEQSAVLEDVYA